MDLITTQKAADRKQLSSSCVQVPEGYSRSKARIYLQNRETNEGHPADNDIRKLYQLFLKIGADRELPDEHVLIEGYLSDFWNTMYFENNQVPDDIPFDIILDEFTKAMVQGTVERHGNNQAAICKAFTQWVTDETVRNRLYSLRDHRYPNNKPRQLRESPGYSASQEEADHNDLIRGKKVKDWPDEVLIQQHNLIMNVIYSDDTGRRIIENLGGKGYMSSVLNEVEERGLVK